MSEKKTIQDPGRAPWSVFTNHYMNWWKASIGPRMDGPLAAAGGRRSLPSGVWSAEGAGRHSPWYMHHGHAAEPSSGLLFTGEQRQPWRKGLCGQAGPGAPGQDKPGGCEPRDQDQRDPKRKTVLCVQNLGPADTAGDGNTHVSEHRAGIGMGKPGTQRPRVCEGAGDPPSTPRVLRGSGEPAQPFLFRVWNQPASGAQRKAAVFLQPRGPLPLPLKPLVWGVRGPSRRLALWLALLRGPWSQAVGPSGKSTPF